MVPKSGGNHAQITRKSRGTSSSQPVGATVYEPRQGSAGEFPRFPTRICGDFRTIFTL